MDKLTLELFTNRTQYRRYLSKNDPEKYSILEEKREKRHKYKSAILEQMEQLLTFPDVPVSTLIQETFDHFVDVVIKEIEMKELELKDIEDTEEEEGLFTNMDSDDNIKKPSPILRVAESERKTFWKTHTNADFSYGEKQDGIFNHYPTNTSVRKRFVGRRNSMGP